jgi:solute carrier family 38 (sodium-coupled neutral amino acid transporter), member 11
MPQDDGHTHARSEEGINRSGEEGRALLSNISVDHEDEDEDGSFVAAHDPSPQPLPNGRPGTKRQSSLSQPPSGGQPRTPRTPNRVRFDLDDVPSSPDNPRANGHPPGSPLWIDEDDYLHSNVDARQHAPLLSGITAPSDSPFLSDSFQPEDHLPNARPKSGIRSAFMNMANSIIGAGIIGQPYAFRQAGLTMGIILLVSLTIIVDWTIRLIVINSKLSGADSFQATMQHCFGQSGLVAISVAQWAFAFGGMVAFCVIVGDTIPHVVEALIPGLRDMSFLWLLTDRRFVIVLFVLGVSWPLSLYRDIAKVSLKTFFGDSRAELTDTQTAIESIYTGVDQHVCDHHYGHHTRCTGTCRKQRRFQRSFIRERWLLPSRKRHLIR